jgi:polysaccharide export outer membrane protein
MLLGLSSTAFADTGAGPLAPLTKLRLTVVQFAASTGDFKRWDALSGDLQVSPDGTVVVPVLGTLPAANTSADALAAEIAARLQAKLGLVDRPDATLQIVEYPPIFVTGAVAVPGQYAFRPGMTVLQAMAMGGGQYRADSHAAPNDTIRLQSDLQGGANAILRTTARLARLAAQLGGAKDITFPSAMNVNDPVVAGIMAQEKVIFAAQQNELARQSAALTDLGTLYQAEISALDEKGKAIDDEIGQAQQQLTGVRGLVAKGVVVLSRQTDLERSLAGLRADRLDNIIATMSARQGLSESTRNLAKVEDDNRSSLSVQLQNEQANLEQLQLTQTTNLRLLRQATSFAAADADSKREQAGGLVYSIVREVGGKPSTIVAAESTVLQPGDLVKVAVSMGPDAPAAGAALASTAPQTQN